MSHSSRLQQIADLHDTFNESLQRGVAQRVNTDEQTIEDACSYAWLQLLTHPNVSLTPEPPLLGWLTRTAVRGLLSNGAKTAANAAANAS